MKASPLVSFNIVHLLRHVQEQIAYASTGSASAISLSQRNEADAILGRYPWRDKWGRPIPIPFPASEEMEFTDVKLDALQSIIFNATSGIMTVAELEHRAQQDPLLSKKVQYIRDRGNYNTVRLDAEKNRRDEKFREATMAFQRCWMPVKWENESNLKLQRNEAVASRLMVLDGRHPNPNILLTEKELKAILAGKLSTTDLYILDPAEQGQRAYIQECFTHALTEAHNGFNHTLKYTANATPLWDSALLGEVEHTMRLDRTARKLLDRLKHNNIPILLFSHDDYDALVASQKTYELAWHITEKTGHLNYVILYVNGQTPVDLAVNCAHEAAHYVQDGVFTPQREANASPLDRLIGKLMCEAGAQVTHQIIRRNLNSDRVAPDFSRRAFLDFLEHTFKDGYYLRSYCREAGICDYAQSWARQIAGSPCLSNDFLFGVTAIAGPSFLEAATILDIRETVAQNLPVALSKAISAVHPSAPARTMAFRY
jgi:hypothetical protein